MQNKIHFKNDGPIQRKIDDKARYALGRGYRVIDRSTHSHRLYWLTFYYSVFSIHES